MSYRRVRDNVKPEFLRLKQAMVVFDMGQEKIEQLAHECGAYYKIDKYVLINYVTQTLLANLFLKEMCPLKCT